MFLFSIDATVGYDIALSECFVELRPRSCGISEARCRQAFMFVTAVTDFQHDGRTTNEIITGNVVSSDPFWRGFNPDDLEVRYSHRISYLNYYFFIEKVFTF